MARNIRARIIENSHKTQTPHLGSCLSCVDILVAAYFAVLRIDPGKPTEESRDRFILSKGHAAPALFQVLARRGYYPESMLDSYGEDGGVFAEHPPAPSHLPGIEAATGSQNVENLAVIVDFNKWQATGRSAEVMGHNSLVEKWRAFGWSASEIDGHNMGELVRRLQQIPDRSGKPVAIVANTVKGKGVSFMEDDNNWHYRIPSADEVKAAKLELGVPA